MKIAIKTKGSTLFFFVLVLASLFFVPAVAAAEPASATHVAHFNDILGALRDLPPPPVPTPSPEPVAPAPLFYWTELVTTTTLNRREHGLDLRGRVPFFTYPENIDYAENTKLFVTLRYINDVIDAAITAKEVDARNFRARMITYDFDIFYYDYILSVVIRSTVANATTRTSVVSVNFNTQTGDLLTATDVVGAHVVQLMERLIAEMIRREPLRFVANVSMGANQAFSLSQYEIAFWFNGTQFTVGDGGAVRLALRLDDISEAIVTPDRYITRPGFGIKMIPLNYVATALGYDVRWPGEAGERDIIRLFLGDDLIIVLTENVNNYQRERDGFVRSLEAAPEIIDGRTYVPISFFDQILTFIAFHIDDGQNIKFATYRVSDTFFEHWL